MLNKSQFIERWAGDRLVGFVKAVFALSYKYHSALLLRLSSVSASENHESESL